VDRKRGIVCPTPASLAGKKPSWRRIKSRSGVCGPTGTFDFQNRKRRRGRNLRDWYDSCYLLCTGVDTARNGSRPDAPRKRFPSAGAGSPGGQKNTFRGQNATKYDTRPFRRGKRPCEKSLAQAVDGKSGQKTEKTRKNGEKRPIFQEFSRRQVIKGEGRKMSDKRLSHGLNTDETRINSVFVRVSSVADVRLSGLQRSIGSGPTHQSCPFCQPEAPPSNERKMISDNSLRRCSMHAPPDAAWRGGACAAWCVACSWLDPPPSSFPASHNAGRLPKWQSRHGSPAGSVGRNRAQRTRKRGAEGRIRPGFRAVCDLSWLIRFASSRRRFE
jgi:hypothetical protein